MSFNYIRLDGDEKYIISKSLISEIKNLLINDAEFVEKILSKSGFNDKSERSAMAQDYLIDVANFILNNPDTVKVINNLKKTSYSKFS